MQIINNKVGADNAPFVCRALLLLAIVTLLTFSALAQSTPVVGEPLTPFVSELKGVGVGMSIDEVIEEFGKPKVADETGMYFEFSKGASAQVGLDAKGKARTIALIFTDKSSETPAFADVFGPDVASPEKADGSIYKLIRYKDAGFWIAYSRSAGDKPMTTVTMRKILK